ncbi:MAG: hypothetical protein L3K17_06360, partial [Thermoplasmata archaeon]|nr:hypothetical protein [Thermoplasmata archaeon]
RVAAARGAGPGSVPLPMSPRPSSGPNLSFGVVMTYDAADGYVVAVSLNDSGGPTNNTYGPSELTWKFSAGNWSLVNTTGNVPATLNPALVYDARDGYVLLYGGYLMATGASTAPICNQTWSYVGGAWTNLSSTSNAAPYAVDFPNMVYDASDEYVLLYDEVGTTYHPLAETLETTWSYVGGTWTNLTATAGTPPAFFGSMTYDTLDGYVLYFGGYTLSDQLSNATFTFSGGSWSNTSSTVRGAPSARCYYGIAYDAGLKEVLLYGGLVQLYVYNSSEYSTETWGYAGGTWTLLASNGTSYNTQSMVYDVADNETILLGSSNFTLSPPNVVTWVFFGNHWGIGAPALAPSSRIADAGRAFTLRVTDSPNAGGLSYQYTGLPIGCSSANTARLTCIPTVTGNYSIGVEVSGAGGFFATARTTIEVAAPPAVIAFTPTASVGEVGTPIGFALAATSGAGGLTYSYLGLPAGCLSANTPQLTCVPAVAGSFTVTADVTDTVGFTAAGSAIFQVVPALEISAFGPVQAVADAGQSVHLHTTLIGGVGPFAYQYTGLPAGCAGVDTGTVSCRLSAVGNFAIGVHASDSLGVFAQGRASLLVNPSLTVNSLGLSTTLVPVGGSTVLTTSIAGGTAPFEYAYTGLPNGCTGVASASVTCASLAAGTYTVSVTITDATGAVATGTGTFTVQAIGTSPIGPVGPSNPSGAASPTGAASIGFWWGFAVSAIAIAFAAVIGGYRLHLARQGRDIVRGLRAEDPQAGGGLAGPTTSPGAKRE